MCVCVLCVFECVCVCVRVYVCVRVCVCVWCGVSLSASRCLNQPNRNKLHKYTSCVQVANKRATYKIFKQSHYTYKVFRLPCYPIMVSSSVLY